MTKRFSKSFFMTICALVAVVLLSFGGTTLAGFTGAETASTLSGQTLSATAYRRTSPNTVYTSNRKGSYDNSSYTEYEWKDISKIKFSFDSNGQIPTGDNLTYTYSIELQYEQRYITDTNESFDEYDNMVVIENVFSSTTPLNSLEAVSEAVTAHEYYIDAYTEEEGTAFGQREHKNYGNGWGIYKFIIHVGLGNATSSGLQYYDAVSEYIFIAPSAITANPNIVRSDASGITNIGDSHLFTITNEEIDGYKYCNQNLITWYVKGESADGKSYVLSEKDLTLDEFLGYTNAIFTGEPERNGTTFLFDSNSVAGTWQVYCVVYNVDGTATQFKSNELDVTTGSAMQPSVIIWIIVACAVVLLGIVILIIVLAKKKEKVW